ncbi:MAG: winged helix-turn-helix domain-containing protein [Candidatus Ancillula sp.]|jgi:two-component system alkaline phosphatase synthesis response regulator PhoP|nr:winged helix-turn-helix domain-containing protein [Candidatus Ancillula sp.]
MDAENNSQNEQMEYKFMGLCLNTNLRKVFVNNTPVKLTFIDYNILLYLMQNANKCVSRDEIFKSIWGYSFNYRTQSDESLLNTHISVIRNKLAKVDKKASKYIITEKCFGYRLGEDFFSDEKE